MGQFDYPRINFSGSAIINPATANNNLLLPLVIYDPLTVKAVLPPRLYCSDELLTQIQLGMIHPGSAVQYNEKAEPYIAIDPINTPELFMEWVTTPLGSSRNDTEFHTLYQSAKTWRSHEPLTGKLPAGWNYFGGMDFAFQDVAIDSVELKDENQNLFRYTKSSEDVSETISDILHSAIDLNNDRNKSSAVMIDVIPGISFYSQIFCDSFRLIHEKGIWMKGRPEKASLRFLNPWRILNQDGALGSSGTFYCGIKTENIQLYERAPLLQFFTNQARSEKRLKGVFIRFNLYGVSENENPDYSETGKSANPALASMAGSISPWYDEELNSYPLSRVMLPNAPIEENKYWGSFPFYIDEDKKVILCDFLGTIPLLKDEKNQHLTLWKRGILVFCLEQDEKTHEIARLSLDETTGAMEVLKSAGGIIPVPYQLSDGLSLADNILSVLWIPETDRDLASVPLKILQESPYQIATDQSGLYIDQGENSKMGYRSHSALKEPCSVHLLKFGKIHASPVPLSIVSFDIKSSAADAETKSYLETDAFVSGTEMYFPTENEANRLYVFYPGEKKPTPGNPIEQIIKTGFFINLRVLPTKDYGQYLDTTHPGYPAAVPWDLVYKELLEVSHLIYPMSSIITPFTESYFKKGWPYIKTRINPENWASYTYMPSSRDMPEKLYKLICKWAEQNITD